MKKYILTLPIFLLLIFHVSIISINAQPKTLKQGFYKAEDLNLSPNTKYTVQNTSFNERIYIFILDSTETPIHAIRL